MKADTYMHVQRNCHIKSLHSKSNWQVTEKHTSFLDLEKFFTVTALGGITTYICSFHKLHDPLHLGYLWVLLKDTGNLMQIMCWTRLTGTLQIQNKVFDFIMRFKVTYTLVSLLASIHLSKKFPGLLFILLSFVPSVFKIMLEASTNFQVFSSV